MSGLLNSELWTSFCNEYAQGRNIPSWWKLLPTIDEQDIRDLFDFLPRSSELQLGAAVHALLVLYNNHDRRFFSQIERLKRLSSNLQAVAVNGYPLAKHSQNAVWIWLGLDSESAAQWVNHWVDRNGIPEASSGQVMLHLSLGNLDSVARLRRFAESNPQIKVEGNAALVLERTASDWREKLKQYGKEWQEKRDCRTLRHLAEQLINRQPPEDAYMSNILEVLGPPDSLVDRCYTYFTKPEFQGWLFVEADHGGKIVGWKLENC